MTRRFNASQRAALYLAADGRCAQCGDELGPDWHADHIHPWIRGGETDVINGQALCAACNLRKGASVTNGLRDWQVRAIETYQRTMSSQDDFLLVATPGAGKTRVACEIASMLAKDHTINFLLILTPSGALKRQWADAFSRYGLKLNPNWEGHTARDVRGIAITYQALCGLKGDLIRRACATTRALVVFDEVHHLSDKREWGERAQQLLRESTRRLALSGTPFRSDQNPIPFVTYEDGRARADFTYSYGDAVRDRVCRPVTFPRRGGNVTWQDDGWLKTASFDTEDLDERDRSSRLRAAIAADGGWLNTVLAEARQQVKDHRAHGDHDAAGLVIADDKLHAERISKLIPGSTLVTSDHEDAKDRIEAFRDGTHEWIVAVSMVSEGVDISRLRVVVYATARTTELFFRQAVGRCVRVDTGDRQYAQVFIPDDDRLRQYAAEIREERIHIIGEDEETEREGAGVGDSTAVRLPFVPIDSEAHDKGIIGDEGIMLAPELVDRANALKVALPELAAREVTEIASILERVEEKNTPAQLEEPAWRRDEELRRRNSRAVNRLSKLTGEEHAHVNFAANCAVSIGRIDDASTEQLEARLRWLTDKADAARGAAA